MPPIMITESLLVEEGGLVRAVGVALCQNVEPEDKPVQETAEHLYEEKQGDGSSQGLSPAVQITTRLK